MPMVSSFGKTAIGWMALIVIAALATLAARHVGALQRFELLAYDMLLALRTTQAATDPAIVIVEYRGDDEARYGYPLPDGDLVDLLEQLLAEDPVAIGLDLIRDRPEPAEGTDFERLSHLLDVEPSITGIVWSQAGEYGPPPILEGRIDRLGASDIIEDPDKKVRRGLLFVDIEGHAVPSLALQLALRHADAFDIDGDYQQDRLELGQATFVPLELASSPVYPRNGSDDDRRGYQFLLTYPACEGGFATFSVSDVLEGRARGQFAERIVLIGNTKRTYQDFRAVPLPCESGVGQDLFGVHIHAQMTRQLIDQAEGKSQPIETTAQKLDQPALGEALDMIWISLWVLPASVASSLLASPVLLAVACFSMIGLLLAMTASAFVWMGWWLPLAPPLMSFGLSALLSIAFLLSITRTERERALTMLRGLLSRKVATALFDKENPTPSGLAPSPMTATVFFSDIAGFTTISERLPEEHLAPWLNDYLKAMVDIIERHGGVVEKFAGDGITAEFGVPEGHVDPEDIAADAKAAVDAGLDMAVALDRLNERWQRRDLPMIGIRIGIHTGPLMVGAVGSEARWQYSIIGDTANTAARLESYGKDDPKWACAPGDCRIFVSSTTMDHVGSGYQKTFVGQISLRGKTQKVGVYRLDSKSKKRMGAQDETPI